MTDITQLGQMPWSHFDNIMKDIKSMWCYATLNGSKQLPFQLTMMKVSENAFVNDFKACLLNAD